ncbi:aminoglycoside phosphotransferase family protein [Streptomyces radicis]|uniref:Aminoglycoside phosphotransferase family protein n=2 Tax=Streptomyces radicis TaxID=1750517 RepID=A0A3A9WG62_9ACTN|nr:aminoglycoside phosphotransferase family protein [Streptomyces radicis]RKN26846.1 aminoglycoside phosphotransferase family protein [Streptomyces radicis]
MRLDRPGPDQLGFDQLAAGLAPSAAAAEPVVLADRPTGTVIRVGDAVAKAHPETADVEALAARVATAAHPALAGILLPPLPPATVARLADGRAATLWPYGTPVDPDDVPWEAVGTLLARLHATDLGPLGPLPPAGWPARAAEALARLRATETDPAHAPARSAVERILCAPPPPFPAPGAAVLCHGDFHLGQLVSHPAGSGSWRLIDVDELGLGDPAWDLARPAAWFAAGLLPPADWHRLLGAYRAAAPGWGGADPWALLDGPARVMTAQAAARALVRAAESGRSPSDEDEALLISCLRIVALP